MPYGLITSKKTSCLPPSPAGRGPGWGLRAPPALACEKDRDARLCKPAPLPAAHRSPCREGLVIKAAEMIAGMSEIERQFAVGPGERFTQPPRTFHIQDDFSRGLVGQAGKRVVGQGDHIGGARMAEGRGIDRCAAGIVHQQQIDSEADAGLVEARRAPQQGRAELAEGCAVKTVQTLAVVNPYAVHGAGKPVGHATGGSK